MDWFSFIFVLLAAVFSLVVAGLKKNVFFAIVAGLVFFFLGSTIASTGIDVATGGTSLTYDDGNNITAITPDYNNLSTGNSATVNVFADLFVFGGLGLLIIVPLAYVIGRIT
jgi:hypothetical protein